METKRTYSTLHTCGRGVSRDEVFWVVQKAAHRAGAMGGLVSLQRMGGMEKVAQEDGSTKWLPTLDPASVGVLWRAVFNTTRGE